MSPTIQKSTARGLETVDLATELFRSHQYIFLNDKITDSSANDIIMQFFHLSDSPDKNISFYINSPGGEVSAGLAIYDVIKWIQSRGYVVSTICFGAAASMAAVLMAAGTKGQRYAFPHAEIMIHQPSGGTQGQASDIHIQAEHLLKKWTTLSNILSKETGTPLDKVIQDCNRDHWLSTQEAISYGIIDSIFE